MINLGFLATARREVRRMGSRKMYLFGMILVPVLSAMFFMSLLGPGLPLKVPTAIVDLDHSELSRSVTRSLNATELLDINLKEESYDDALAAVRRGEVFGFFVIPANFQQEVYAGRTPTLEYYSNMTYFVPGTLSFKGFKTVAVTTSGAVMRTTLVSLGADPEQIGALMQPVSIQEFPLGNPWMSYSIYLCPSFAVNTFLLMVILMTVFSITMEIKQGTSTEWLATARGHIGVAVAGKLLPQTMIFFAVGAFIMWLLFGYAHFPVNGSLAWLLVAMALTIIASQAFAVFICSVIPNPRLAFSVCALFSILSFSFTGFSFPVEDMYGYLGVFSYLAPVRYFFLIYIREALNGVDLYYSRYYFAALLAFPLVASTMLWHLRKACLRPVYVP